MWEIIDTYWVYFLIGQYPHGPLGGLAVTVSLAVAAILLALPLGVLLGVAKASRRAALRRPVQLLVATVRGLPLLMVVFWAYFFLPALTGVKTGPYLTLLVALVVFDAAYLADIVRAGLQAVPKGQWDSAGALGLTTPQILRLVVLPQALRPMLPSLVNQFVATLKATSLGYIIGLNEISFIATQVNTQVFTHALEVYTLLGLTYFILCFALSQLAQALERRWSPAPGRLASR